MKKIYIYSIITLILASCSDFLDKYPGDSLSPEIFWKTESDAKLGLTGCYNGWEGTDILYMDCTSDNAYSFHEHEKWQVIGNGYMSASDEENSFFRNCLSLLQIFYYDSISSLFFSLFLSNLLLLSAQIARYYHFA